MTPKIFGRLAVLCPTSSWIEHCRFAMPPLMLALLVSPASASTMIEAYPSETSVSQGDTLLLHVSTKAPKYHLSIWRQGRFLEFVADGRDYPGTDFPVPPTAWESGCGWPVTCKTPIPRHWKPGAYIAQLDGGHYSARIPFVVRAEVPGSAASMLVQLCIDTWQAYNMYGGKSLYRDALTGASDRAHRVSFQRPYSYPAADGSGQFFLWEAPFISYLETEGYAYEVCTNVDLHRYPGLLNAYRLFVSVGHDEYYSKEMYDELERFADAGGNLAFFSGNTLWWQVRFEAREKTLVCYKAAELDPLNGVDNSRVTVHWHDSPVSRRPASLMGSQYNYSTVPAGAYQVVDPKHWAFQGARVDSGQSFGFPMVAYEIDSSNQDSPLHLDILARTELPDLNRGTPRIAEITYYERSPEYGFPKGRGGKIFAGGSTNFVQGIIEGYNTWTRQPGRADPIARTMTQNVLDRLDCSLSVPSLVSPKSGARVAGKKVFVQWYAARTQRPGIPVRYTVLWCDPSSRIDSLETSNLAAWIPTPQDSTIYDWWVRARSECGTDSESPVESFGTGGLADSGADPYYPILSISTTAGLVSIFITSGFPAPGSIEIFDVAGRRVRSYDSLRIEPGPTRVDWDLRRANGARVSAGIYFVRVNLGSKRFQKKVLALP